MWPLVVTCKGLLFDEINENNESWLASSPVQYKVLIASHFWDHSETNPTVYEI